MSGTLPAYVLKDCTLFVNGVSKVGQSQEISLPVLEIKTEEMRNGGMIKPREVFFGFSVLQASFTLAGFDPAMFGLFGITIGQEFPLFAYGYMQSENGKQHSARAEMGVMMKKVDPGTWKPGEPAPTEHEVAVQNFRLFVDDEEIASVTDFDAVFNGVSVTPGRADALRL